MTIRFSTGLRNFVNESGSYKQALANGKLKVYSGSQPASANDAPTGTLLYVVSKSSGAVTEEVKATGTVTLTGGASGSVDSVSVDSKSILPAPVAFDTDLATTAAAVAEAINNNPKNALFTASASGAVVTIVAKPGLGAAPNTWVVASTATTITKTDADMSGGVDAVNCLTFGDSAAGTLVKNPAESWTGVGLASGTAGWFRFEGAGLDGGAADSSESKIRIDGNVSTSGGNLNMSSTLVALGATQTISSFSITIPASS